ncbi:hypothetical protein E2C01_043604 [Portunus trituberculatus]|uniref:Uncharacterized protein n=1 Tax=Portunus trituberculatus TaxID=210409 RepID=A0A5B7FPX1_PORTR|nr:hypothetical protein [Portunus trituberculatus]
MGGPRDKWRASAATLTQRTSAFPPASSVNVFIFILVPGFFPLTPEDTDVKAESNRGVRRNATEETQIKSREAEEQHESIQDKDAAKWFLSPDHNLHIDSSIRRPITDQRLACFLLARLPGREEAVQAARTFCPPALLPPGTAIKATSNGTTQLYGPPTSLPWHLLILAPSHPGTLPP